MTNVGQLQAPCLADLTRWADETPDAPALLGSGEPAVSFSALTARIARVAQLLRTAGVRRGEVVAVAMPDGPGFFTALLGAVDAAAAAPLDWSLTQAEFRSRLTLLRPSILMLRSRADGQGAAVADSLGIPVALADGDLSELPDISPHPIRVPKNCALVMQTSATTGEAKLVPFTQTNLHAICTDALRGLALRADDRYLSIMPLHHILGFCSALGQLMAGGSVACTGFDGQRLPAWLGELSPTWYAAGPALHQAILEMAKEDPEPFRRSSLRFVRCGSGAGSIALLDALERVLQVDVINGYGLTEAGPVTNTPRRQPRKPGSVGRTIGPDIGIVDLQGNLLAPGAEGEVALRGNAVMEGYLGAEDLNREVFRGGWFHTGDLGHMDGDGDLFITGRIKEVINRGGETISPLEIDHALAEHPGIAHAACFGIPHPTLGEDVVGAVVLRPGAKATASEVRSFLKERLSRSKIPGRIWFLESIPVSSSGKPLRDKLQGQFQASARPQESTQTLAPGDEATALLRRQIGTAWMRVLNSDAPESEDNFFAMGGDSLSAARLFTMLAAEFQIEEASLDLQKFLDSPTFFQLVQVAASRKETNPSEVQFEDVSAVCLRPSGAGPPVFFFPGEGLGPWSVRHLARVLGEHHPFFALRHQLTNPADFGSIASRFVTLISRVHPDGPIVLAGHCYGGVLAYEVAQRMLSLSRPSVAVVLIDAATPGYQRVRANLPDALRAVLRGDGPKLASELAGHLRFVREKGGRLAPAPAAYQPVVAEAVVPETVVPETMRAPDAPKRTGGLTPGGVILLTYRPKPFPGPLASAFSGGSEAGEKILRDSKRGWRQLAQGPFSECALQGSHHSIFDAEHVPELANFIRSAIRDLAQAGTAVL